MVPIWVAILGGQIISNKIHYNYSIIYIYLHIYIYIYYTVYIYICSLYISTISNYIIVYPTVGFSLHFPTLVKSMPSKSSRTSRTWFRRATRSSFFQEVGGTSKSWDKGIHHQSLLDTSKNGWNWMWYVNHQSDFATWGLLKPDPKKVVDYVTSWYVTSFQIALQDTFREDPCRSRLKCHIDNHQNRRPKKAEQSSWSHDLMISWPLPLNKQVYGMSGFPLRL